MELIYDLEGAGWAGARISDGARHRDFSVSYLSDALGDMAKAAAMLLNGSREESFSFLDEPGEHRFVLTRGDADSLAIRVLWFERTFSGRADRFGEDVFRCECSFEWHSKRLPHTECADYFQYWGHSWPLTMGQECPRYAATGGPAVLPYGEPHRGLCGPL